MVEPRYVTDETDSPATDAAHATDEIDSPATDEMASPATDEMDSRETQEMASPESERMASPADAHGPEGEPGRRSRRPSVATVGTLSLLGIMVVAGLSAAFMVTPRPDEDAMARPREADLVLAGGAPLSWDPAAISDSVSAGLLSQVFEGLTTLDGDSVLRPALAETWSVEDEGHRVVFQLRDGLTFSDGSPLAAADVRRSWLRLIDPTRLSPLSSLLDDVVGARAYARGEASADRVGLRAEGRRLTVDLVRPAAYFPTLTSVPSLAVVPASMDQLVAGPRSGTTFAASGPFVPEEGGPGEVRLRANEDYWAGRPTTGRISVVTDMGGRSEVDVFEDEAVDWTPISADDAAWIRFDQRLGPQLRQFDEMAVELLGFDTSESPFDDVRARRAVAMAVDWRGLPPSNAGGTGSATSIVPPGVAARPSGDFLPPYDPEAARDALAAAGYPGGEGFPSVTLASYGIGPAAAIAYELELELGIDVELELWSYEDHATLLASDPPALWTLAWSADYPHANDFLGLLLRSDSSANVGSWSAAHFDALLDAAASTADPVAQERLYGQAQSIIRDEVPLIPLGYSRSWALSREGLSGAGVSGTGTQRYEELAWSG